MATLTDLRTSGAGIGPLLVLSHAEEIGPGAIDRLLEAYGSPEQALAAAQDAPELSAEQRAGIRRALGGQTASRAARNAERTQRDALPRGARWLTRCDATYPARLRRLARPPAILWLRGPLPLASAHSVAIVGTRTATPDGRRLAYELARDLARRGVRIVSGLAAGVDAAAHQGALDAGGETVAVLGSGIDREYPASNRSLYRRIREEGVLLSEFRPGTRPERYNFPRRNRIVAGLVDVVVVVEAGARSGALSTARHALDIGVDVMACPGSPRSPSHAGSNDLLLDGAPIVTDASQVCAALGDLPGPGAPSTPASRPPQRSGPEADILRRLAKGPATLSELMERGGFGPVSSALARLELEAVVRGLPGGRYELER